MKIGVLGLQGGFAVHVVALQRVGYQTTLIKTPEDLEGISGLVMPGGESTVQSRLLKQQQLWKPLNLCVRSGLPVFATCAGVVLAAKEVQNPSQPSFGWLPVTVRRNGYGDQRNSFETEALFEGHTTRLVFIRAPKILSIHDPKVKTLMTVEKVPVLVEYRNIVAATFHPELSDPVLYYHYCFRRPQQLDSLAV